MLTTPFSSGHSARLLSKYRPICPIIMVTRNGIAARVSFVLHSPNLPRKYTFIFSPLNLIYLLKKNPTSVLPPLPRRVPVHLPRKEARFQPEELARGRRQPAQVRYREGHRAPGAVPRRLSRLRARVARRYGPYQHHPRCAGGSDEFGACAGVSVVRAGAEGGN